MRHTIPLLTALLGLAAAAAQLVAVLPTSPPPPPTKVQTNPSGCVSPRPVVLPCR